MLRDDGRGNATSGTERAGDRHTARLTERDQVVEDLIRDRFVEDAFVAELDEVQLQRFQFHALFVGYILNADFAEVGQPGFRTDGRELGRPDVDLVLALGTRIGEGLQ